jgi:hypothetical protein
LPITNIQIESLKIVEVQSITNYEMNKVDLGDGDGDDAGVDGEASTHAKEDC